MNKRKAILVLSALLILISVVVIRRESHVIGEISGPEFDRLTIGSEHFLLTDNHGFTSADRGQFIGKASYHTGISLRLYSVKGENTGKLIYALWDWEGFWYLRQD